MLIFILWAFIAITESISTADTITDEEITHPTAFCNSKTIKNKFDARITTIKSGESYQGTVIFVPGGLSQEFVSEKASGLEEGMKELERELWDLGYRLLEIRWNDALGPDPDDKYDDSHSCQHYALANALNVLKDENIGTSSDKWWPASQSDRYAIGISEGQVQLMYTIDKVVQSFTDMNRVVYGGGGCIFDYYDQLNCNNVAQKHIDAIEFSFDGASTKCDNDPTCDGDSWLVDHLEDDSIEPYIGDSDDYNRVTKVLFNTGWDISCNNYFNNLLYETRSGSASQKGMWNFTRTWCGASDVNGHSLINSVYDIKGDVDDWVDFFVNGDMTFPACPP